MSALYSQMAAKWWDALTPEKQTEWLDAAEADGRERHPLAAYTLMGDLPEQDAEHDRGR
ncbi:MAG: hypothetical protein HIU85_06610 [Proteobacteria bacterium]|nr:hypothetical protein [Pseudomonadota bacterium]